MYINKLSGIVVTIAISVICAFHVFSMHEYIPTVRYDRVWECTSSDNFHTYTVKYMKFDGTEEINGKMYHRIVTYRKAIMEMAYDSSLDTYEYIDDICELEGYMREDNGKVYTLASGVYDCDGLWYGCLYPWMQVNSGDTIEEFLIYDFTCEQGQQYEALSNRTGSNELVDFSVVSKSIVLIDNEECLHMSVERDGFSPSFLIVEGVGPVLFGCLNYQEHAFPVMMWKCNYFNRVFNISGEVMYKSPDAYDYKLPDNLFSSADVVNDSDWLLVDGGVILLNCGINYNLMNIYSANGGLVKTVSVDSSISIPTSDLAPGIYIVSLQAYNAPALRKKIKIR